VGPDTALRAAALFVELGRNDTGATRVAGVHQVGLDASGGDIQELLVQITLTDAFLYRKSGDAQ